MCPMCAATAAQIIAGAMSTVGLTAYLAKKLRWEIGARRISQPGQRRMDHEQKSKRTSESSVAS